MKALSQILSESNWGWRMSPKKVSTEIYQHGYRNLAWSDLDKSKIGTRISQERKREILKEFRRIPEEIAASDAAWRRSDLYAQLSPWRYTELEDDRCPRCKDYFEWGDPVVYLPDQESLYHAGCAVDELLEK
tara:strand:- start:5388 stop:5783 length:396 start_codon:yes stop_codon:yes gene_type:complete